MTVSEKKTKALQQRMQALGCQEKDLEETLHRGGAVDLSHRPTGIRIRCHRERSQTLNRFLARRTLVDELEARLQNKTRHEVKAEKVRTEKRRLPKKESSLTKLLRQKRSASARQEVQDSKTPGSD
jgi:peptide chain release factor